MNALGQQLLTMGFGTAIGVPDSTLTSLVSMLGQSITVYTAPREDVAVAAACGLELAGSHSLLYLKNAGLLTCGDALLSLARDMEVPLFMLVGWAGSGTDQLPHHVVIGERTTGFLDSLDIPWRVPRAGHDGDLPAWHAACRRRGAHCALLISPGANDA
jgi:sulfopyruvate decarboxylase TPP-binding subunit